MAPAVPHRALEAFTMSVPTHAHCAFSTFCQVSINLNFDLRVVAMELLLVLSVLVWACGCGVLCGVWRRGGEVGRRMRGIGCAAALVGAVTVVTWRMLLLPEDVTLCK